MPRNRDEHAATNRASRASRVCLWLHRQVGLAIAVFLVVAGLTGSVLVFNHELDEALNPQLFEAAPPTRWSMRLDPVTLRERLAAQLPDQRLDTVELAADVGRSVMYWAPTADGYRQHFVDPYSGDLLGARTWGDLSEGLVNLMPFLYRLHYQLALGETGMLLFGIVALLWTVDCFVGLYLTFPPRRAAAAAADQRSWLLRWKPAWLIRAGSLFGAVFTLHRAAGLWLWALLLVFAWSAVGFNLRPVFDPVMGAVLPMRDVWAGLPGLDRPRSVPGLDWRQAHESGRRLMAAEAERRGFAVIAEGSLTYTPEQGLYRYDVHSTHDLARSWPGTRVWFDGDNGGQVAFDAPTGVLSGNTAASWLVALHMGAVGGLAYRLLVVVLGLVVALLSVTGVAIWWRKRSHRTIHPNPDPSQPTPARTTLEAPT